MKRSRPISHQHFYPSTKMQRSNDAPHQQPVSRSFSFDNDKPSDEFIHSSNRLMEEEINPEKAMVILFRQACTAYGKGADYAGYNLYRQNQECPMITMNGMLDTEKFILFLRDYMQEKCSRERMALYFPYAREIIEGVAKVFNNTDNLAYAMNVLLEESLQDNYTHSIVRNTLLTTIWTMFCVPRLMVLCVGLKDKYLAERALLRMKKLRNFTPTAEINFKYCLSMNLMQECNPKATHILKEGERHMALAQQKYPEWYSDLYAMWHVFLSAYHQALKQKRIVDNIRPWVTDEQKVFNRFGVTLIYRYMREEEIDLFN